MKIKFTFFLCIFSSLAFSQVDPFVGEIKIFAGIFAPTGYAFCNGQILSIVENSALFSILGPTYGGNGTTTFALPDLRTRVAIGAGQASAEYNYDIGQTGGSTSTTLLNANLSPHAHVAEIKASDAAATTIVPSTAVSLTIPTDVLNTTTTVVRKFSAATADVMLSTITTSTTGGATPINIEQPYLVCQYIIALYGIFPQRQ